MQKLMREYLNELKNRRRRRRRARIAMVILISLVVGSVIGALAQYGVAMTGNAKCGIEEHQHELACYEKTLVCTQTESEGHQHTDKCYQTETSLVCGLEESEEHTHSDACYVTEQQLICSEEEGTGHQHTDACYEEELACGKELHTHGEECYIDTDADVEDAAVWNKQYEKLEWKDTWSENLVLAAREQIGYKESSDNYTIAEDGSHKGYTRYGQFAVDTGVEAADVYADWDTAFVNFCLFYAGLSTTDIFPDKLDTVEWYEEFRKINENIDEYLSCLVAPEGYTPKAGDIVIFQKGIEEEEREYQMGIVSSYDKEKDELKVIEGNSGNEVKENDYYIEAKDAQDDEMAPVFCYLDMSGLEKAYKGTDEEPEDPVEPGEPVEPEEPEEPKDDVTEEEPKEENPDGETDGEEDPEEEDPEEETIELTTKVDGTTITLSGPASSFEEGKNYEIQAEKVEDEETIATIEEAIDKEVEKQEKKVENYQAFDIKLLLDGEEVQPLGPVEVKFSGKEVKKSVENEDTEVGVLHVDEETGEATDMEATATEDKDVVIETEHFSVYVYVHLTNIFEKINVTVEHWGEKIQTINGSADASEGKDTVYMKGNTSIETKEINKEIYSSDQVTIPNEYYADVTKLSKVCNVNTDINYTVSKVWVTQDRTNIGKSTWSNFQEYPLTSDATITNLKEGSILRFWYVPKKDTNTLQTSVNFYDYDISDGYYYNSSGSDQNINTTATRNYLKTAEKGINIPSNFNSVSGDKLAVGQHASGNRSDWVSTAKSPDGLLLNKTNGKFDNGAAKIVEGIVKDTLTASGDLQFNVKAPKTLFTEGTGSKLYNQYKLGFKQNGDTYTLQYVNDGNSKRTGDLTEIGDYSGAYSNLFWPLDNLNRKPGDPDLGAKGGQYQYLEGNGGTHANNDDIGTDHNWHFGMTYSMEFTIGDYTGPMEFYFRGDDDFWLFIDGQKAIDIGGIHSAVGESIDLRDWMQKKGLLADKTKKHSLKVFYMERGGFGSCCYMQFILPNSVPVTIPEPETTTYEVRKDWDDGDNPYRPERIEVVLLQDGEETSEKVTLTEENNWSYKWEGLPKINGSTQGKYEYTYSVKEIKLPPGYLTPTLSSDNKILTNKLDYVKVKVEKNWVNDSGLESYRPNSVTLRLYANGEEYRDKSGQRKEIILTGDTWSGEFTNLPEYSYIWDEENEEYTAKKVVYSVREIDSNGNVIEEDGTIDGSNNASYTVSYSGGNFDQKDSDGYVASLSVTNTLLTKFKIVKAGADSSIRLQGAKFTLTPYDAGDIDNNGDELGLPEGVDTSKETNNFLETTFSTGTESANLNLPTYEGISDENGIISWTSNSSPVTSIEPGTYLMKEIEAPAGYMLSAEEWIVVVGEYGRATIKKNNPEHTAIPPTDNVGKDPNGELVFEYVYVNEALYELPSTGGPGTYLYMFSGVLLLAVTALITYRNKRKEVLRS